MAKTLLLADDSVVIQKLVALSFANEDVKLVTTDNGDDAIARASEIKPDLVLADVVMPGKSGYEVCEAIRQNPETAQVPVLLLTGTFEAFDAERAQSVRSDGHITKPFEAQALVDRVNDLLSRPPAATPAAKAPGATPGAAEGTPVAAAAPEPAYDFFDDAVEELAVDPEPAPARPTAPARAPEPRSPEPPAFDLGAPEAAAPASPTDSGAPTAPPPIDPPEFDLGLDSGGDRTVAFMPDDPVPAAHDFLAAPASSATTPAQPTPAEMPTVAAIDLDDGDPLAEIAMEPPSSARGASGPDPGVITGSRLSFGEAPAPQAPASDPAATILADDLFGDTPSAAPSPASDSREDAFQFGGVSERSSPTLDDPLLAGSDLMSDPLPERASVSEFDVSSSDLGAPPALRATRAGNSDSGGIPSGLTDPPLEAAFDLPSAEPAPSAAFETPGSKAASALPIADASSAAGPPLGSGAAASQASRIPDLSPMMRERVHETLEKVAWEAFADLSDAIVREVLKKVESVAWEVIPQMAESLIQEEIRRMKGEQD